METLMTVLKTFWPNYKLKKKVNQRKSASRQQDRKDFFKDHIQAICYHSGDQAPTTNFSITRAQSLFLALGAPVLPGVNF